MKTAPAIRRLLSVSALATLGTFGGCIVVPPHHAGYATPPGVVYVAPTYVSPGPGWVWQYHGSYGWGWHHPQNGWHRGWR